MTKPDTTNALDVIEEALNYFGSRTFDVDKALANQKFEGEESMTERDAFRFQKSCETGKEINQGDVIREEIAHNALMKYIKLVFKRKDIK